MAKKKKSSKKHAKTRETADNDDIDVMTLYKRYKKYIPFALLLFFILFGYFLRIYHLNYPVIGYHNWKTAHYITEARNFAEQGFFKYGFFVPMRDTMESIQEQPDGAHPDTFPTISVIVGFLFKIFGQSLKLARIVGIFFSLLSVMFSYLLVKELFEREDLALLTAFLSSINPLYVFFSHNIQLVNPALCFMLAGAYFYVRWIKGFDNNKFTSLYVAAFLVMLATITKYDFAVIGIPMLFIFPYKKVLKNRNRFIMPLAIVLLILSVFPLWYFYNEVHVTKIFRPDLGAQGSASQGLTKLIDFTILSDSEFWQVMKAYIADNYTSIGFILALLGSIFFLIIYILKPSEKQGYRFFIGYIFGSVFFLFIMGFKLSGHNYHQFPIAPLIIFLLAFFYIAIASNLSNFFKQEPLKQTVKIGLVILLIFIFPLPSKSVYTQSIEAKDRMFNTQFPGLDIAGEYIREHASTNERMFHSSHQSFGVLWHAGIKGYKPPANLEIFTQAEEDYNVDWVLVYQWGIQTYFENEELFNHLRENYRLVQFAMIPEGQQNRAIYFLFRRGGTFNESELNTMLQDKPAFKKTYEYTKGPYELIYINLE
ncbi:glycosyltransferase family 39 protein [Candidatus Woesearchaeota archaeon]|nr:glycosyltransferase family 39 protein [Candidatus Woesearchaeota archaeon]